MKARLYKKNIGAESEMLAKRATFGVCREKFLNPMLFRISENASELSTSNSEKGLWSTHVIQGNIQKLSLGIVQRWICGQVIF